MRLYVHYEQPPELTLIYEPQSETVQQMLQVFIDKFNQMNGAVATLQEADCVIQNSSGRVVAGSRTVSKAFKNRDDVFVVCSAPATHVPAATESTSSSGETADVSSVPALMQQMELWFQMDETVCGQTLKKYSTAEQWHTMNADACYAMAVASYWSQNYEHAFFHALRCISQSEDNVAATAVLICSVLQTAKYQAAVHIVHRQLQHPSAAELEPAKRKVLEQVLRQCESLLSSTKPAAPVPQSSFQPVLEKAEQAFAHRSYRTALLLYSNLLKLSNPALQQRSLCRIVEILGDISSFRVILPYFTAALYEGSTFDSTDLLCRCAHVFHQQKMYPSAFYLYSLLLQQVQSSSSSATFAFTIPNQLIGSHQKQKNPLSVVDFVGDFRTGTESSLPNPIQPKSKEEYEQWLSCKLADCLFAMGNVNGAGHLYQSVVAKNDQFPPALLGYGKVAAAIGQVSDSVPAYLRVLLKDQDNAEARRGLARALQADASNLLAQLTGSSEGAGALGFMGTVLKDEGELQMSAQFYQKAVELDPTNASYALNLMHVYECWNKYSEAHQLCLQFVSKCLSAKPLVLGGLDVNHVLAIMKDCSDVEASKLVPCRVQVPDEWIPAAATSASPRFTPETMDVLAVLFTDVKILFIRGCLYHVEQLCKLIDPIRREQDLHKTLIRNEAAYFGTISELMQVHPLFHPPSTSTSTIDAVRQSAPIYVCGDSHSLSSGWCPITVDGTARVLVPALVTGMKIWHLNKNSVFYPKRNFESVVAGIPSGSSVVFLFGEIDCREGLLVSVERMRYDSFDEAARAVITLYLTILKRLKREKNLTIYVHPVAPVLNETRSNVKRFNALLQQMIEKSAPDLIWLDLCAKLLTPDGQKLRPDFELDGTHMSSKYVPDLEQALQTNASQKEGRNE